MQEQELQLKRTFHHIDCHSLCEVSQPKSLDVQKCFLAVGSDGIVSFFVESAPMEWGECTVSVRGARHTAGGRILSVDWWNKPPHNALRLLSTGTDGRVIIWEFDPHINSKEAKMAAACQSVVLLSTGEPSPMHAQWSQHASDLPTFCVSITTGQLFIGHLTDNRVILRKIDLSTHEQRAMSISMLLVFAWVGSALLWGNRFSEDIGVVHCDNWVDDDCVAHVRPLARSFGHILAAAGSESGQLAVWTDSSSVVAFVENLTDPSPALFTLQWFGLPLTCIGVLPNDTTRVVAAGFDGVPVVFSRVGQAGATTFEWTFSRALRLLPSYLHGEAELLASIDSEVGPWVIRTLSITRTGRVTISGDEGIITVYDVGKEDAKRAHDE